MRNWLKNFFASFKVTVANVIAFIIVSLVAGPLGNLGQNLFNKIIGYFPGWSESFLNSWLFNPVTIHFQINPFIVILFLAISFPIYRLTNKVFLRTKKSKIVFHEDFSSPLNRWTGPYWKGSGDYQRKVQQKGDALIFKAISLHWPRLGNENGALYDLREGIFNGFEYEVCCKVKKMPSTGTMEFKLWVHDTIEGNNITEPKEGFMSPSSVDYESVRLVFKATETNALRIHLHCKAGRGLIYVKEVTVTKIGNVKGWLSLFSGKPDNVRELITSRKVR